MGRALRRAAPFWSSRRLSSSRSRRSEFVTAGNAANRNELRYGAFIVRCNISRIVPDFVHAQRVRIMVAAHLKSQSSRLYVVAAAATIGALAISTLLNRRLARSAELDNPPNGQFLEVDGVRLHYVERGTGRPLVLLHGNGSMIQDFESSGLIHLAAKRYRVIVFDRPGFGHTNRPRNVVWTPTAQAELINSALGQLGISEAIVLGHSWGASVAVALGLKYPKLVQGLVLVSGYYYPTLRFDVVALSGPAVPLVGDVLRYTLSPILSRLMWPLLMAKIFGPRPMPKKFEGFPKEMALRPSQIRASAAESALMIPDAFHFRNDYANLNMSVTIVAGEEDRLIDIDAQSSRLHSDVPWSKFHRVPGSGHMVHQTATPAVMSAINEVSENIPRIASVPVRPQRLGT
jgi:pimeloyl-ACP methyl ester carboxylesterase